MFLIVLTTLLSCNNSVDRLNTQPETRHPDEATSQNQNSPKSESDNSQKNLKKEENKRSNIPKKSVLEAKVIILNESASDEYIEETDPFKIEQKKHLFNIILSDVYLGRGRRSYNYIQLRSPSNVVRLEDKSGLYEFTIPKSLNLENEDKLDLFSKKDNFVIFDMEILQPSIQVTEAEIDAQILHLLNKVIDNAKDNKTVAITFNNNKIKNGEDGNAYKKIDVEKMKRFLHFFNAAISKRKDLNLEITFIFSDTLSNKSDIETMFKDAHIPYALSN